MMTHSTLHKSVLTREILEILRPKTGGLYLDATFGGGGHSTALLEASEARVVAVDRDSKVERWAEALQEQYPERFSFEVMSFRDIGRLEKSFDGILFDLGLSSDQLETSGRGFSFQVNQPLDMRFDDRRGQTASQLLSSASMETLAKIFREYGEDRRPNQLARKIVERRRIEPIRTTNDLVELVGTSQPKVLAPIFQALRIAVNDELETLRKGLQAAYECLSSDGVLAVISFHSLEDRIVKHFMKDSGMELITKKPVVASAEEIAENPRSRSAKLRGAKKVM